MKHLAVLLLLFSGACSMGTTTPQLWTNSFDVLPQEAVGKVEEGVFYSQALKRDWKYNVYYPAGFDPAKKYAVVYLLHGAYGKHSNWKNHGEAQIMLDRAIAAKKMPPVIAIMPDGQDSWYSDLPGTNMLTAFEKDLFPYVETNFPTQNSKEARAIGGLSMGGHGAIVFGMRNPSYFGTVFALSPAVTVLGKKPAKDLLPMLEKDFKHIFNAKFSQEKWDAISYEKSYPDYKQAAQPVRFLIAVGTDDIITPAEDSRDLVQKFKTDGVEYRFFEVPSGSHSWGFWTLMLGPSFEYAGKVLPQPK